MVVEELVRRRREVEGEFGEECQKCLQEEGKVTAIKTEVVRLETKLKSTREEVSKAIRDISGPFRIQVDSATSEFADLKSKINEVESSNERYRSRIKHLKEAAYDAEEKNTTHRVSDEPPSNGFLSVSPSDDHGVGFDISHGGYQSFLDVFDSTIRMIEKEIGNSNNSAKNIEYNWFDSPQRIKILAPPSTPSSKSPASPQRFVQRTVESNETINNIVNGNCRVGRPKSSGLLIPAPSANNVMSPPLTPFIFPPSTVPPSRSTLQLQGVFPTPNNNPPKIPIVTSPIFHPRFSSVTSPVSLLPSPTGKRLSTSPTIRAKAPPPPPIKPHITAPKTTQPKPLTSNKQLVLPSRSS